MDKRDIPMIVIALFVILVLLLITGKDSDKAIKDCVDSGNSVEYCESGLR